MFQKFNQNLGCKLGFEQQRRRKNQCDNYYKHHCVSLKGFESHLITDSNGRNNANNFDFIKSANVLNSMLPVPWSAPASLGLPLEAPAALYRIKMLRRRPSRASCDWQGVTTSLGLSFSTKSWQHEVTPCSCASVKNSSAEAVFVTEVALAVSSSCRNDSGNPWVSWIISHWATAQHAVWCQSSPASPFEGFST